VSLPPAPRRSPGRSGLHARWVAGLLALLLGAALASVGAVAGAQQDPGTNPPESSAPETSAPETSAPDTTAPDTSAPDTSAPDTSAPDTSAPDTTAPDQGAGENDPNGNINNLPVNDGVQRGTVFNPVPYGEIPADAPQVVILRPGSGRILPLNRELNIRVRFANFLPGFFSDPASGYGLGPQRLDGNGHLQGHNHACFQRISRNGAVPADPCDSFVVLERDGNTDILTGIAPPLTQPGRYRLCADAASEFHYVGARAFAREGGSTDCVRVLVMDLAQLRNQ
jgi:hypothetical protein